MRGRSDWSSGPNAGASTGPWHRCGSFPFARCCVVAALNVLGELLELFDGKGVTSQSRVIMLRLDTKGDGARRICKLLSKGKICWHGRSELPRSLAAAQFSIPDRELHRHRLLQKLVSGPWRKGNIGMRWACNQGLQIECLS